MRYGEKESNQRFEKQQTESIWKRKNQEVNDETMGATSEIEEKNTVH